MKKGRRITWEELDLKIEKQWATLRGVLSSDAIKEFHDELDRGAESWVKAVVEAVREADRKKGRLVKNTPAKTTKNPSVPTRARTASTTHRRLRP